MLETKAKGQFLWLRLVVALARVLVNQYWNVFTDRDVLNKGIYQNAMNVSGCYWQDQNTRGHIKNTWTQSVETHQGGDEGRRQDMNQNKCTCQWNPAEANPSKTWEQCTSRRGRIRDTSSVWMDVCTVACDGLAPQSAVYPILIPSIPGLELHIHCHPCLKHVYTACEYVTIDMTCSG